MAMVIAMALMSGYTDSLKRKLVGLQGDVIASPITNGDFETHKQRLADARIEGVEGIGQVAYGAGSISAPGSSEGLFVVLRGIEAGSAPKLLDAGGNPTVDGGSVDLAADEKGVPGAFFRPRAPAQAGARGR